MYEYKPLEIGHLRLLELLPGQAHEGLKCSLTDAQLDQFPEYEAISYCWGDPDRAHFIRCEEESIQITPNLAHGLTQLRYTDKPRTLWADQICINQADSPERSSQVNMMGKIFKQAKCVLIWLGPDDSANPQAPLAMNILEKVATLPPQNVSQSWEEDQLVELGFPPPSSPAWTAFRNFVKLPYFERSWIFQEVFLASSTLVLWGTTALRQDHLSSFIDRIPHLSRETLGLTTAEVRNFNISMGIRNVGVKRSLLNLADLARTRKSKDPKDMIFALLGMVESNSSILADYSKSLVEVYTSAAHHFIEDSPNSLDFLSEAGTQRLVEADQIWETWPSWVPSFPAHRLVTIRWRRPWCRADAQEPRRIAQLPHAQEKLCVDGVEVSRVSQRLELGAEEQSNGYAVLMHRILEAYALLKESWSAPIGSRLDESLLLPSVIRTTLIGSYEDMLVGSVSEGIPGQLHNMYEDFISMLLYVTLLDLESGRLNSLHMLQQQLEIADQAVTCAWLSHPDKYTSSDAPSRLAVAEIKQEYEHRTNSVSAEQQALVNLSQTALATLDWSDEDLDTATVLIAGLLYVVGRKVRFWNAAYSHSLQRIFFATEHGLPGNGPPAVQPGDIVVILFGGQSPFALRPANVNGEYYFIGECYVDGIMHGEYVERLKASGKFEECTTSFTLV